MTTRTRDRVIGGVASRSLPFHPFLADPTESGQDPPSMVSCWRIVGVSILAGLGGLVMAVRADAGHDMRRFAGDPPVS